MMTDFRSRALPCVTVLAVALITPACTPTTEVPFVLEDLAGTYRLPGIYGTLYAVDDTALCQGSTCVQQVRVSEFEQVTAAGEREECTLYVGGGSLELRANSTFLLEGTRRQDCTGPHLAGVVITREALSVGGLYRLRGDGSGGLIVLQSVGSAGTFRLEGRVEGVASVTSNGQFLPEFVHVGVRDRSGTEFTTTWSR